jgi:very-short-patch-repair endonuclease
MFESDSDDVDVAQLLRQLGGVATVADFGKSVTHHQLAKAVAAGQIRRPGFNRYTLLDVDAHRRTAAKAGGVTSHLSAALHYGWKVKFDPVRPCVTVPRTSRKPVGVDCELHWATLTDKERHRYVTSRTRTVIDCARAYDFDVALSVADSALREGVIDKDDLEVAAAKSPRTGRARAMEVVRAATPLHANPFESCLAAILRGVPSINAEPQVEIEGVGRVDFLDRRLGMIVEAESLQFHGTRVALERDTKRYASAARLGLVVVRFTWDPVMHWPGEVHDALEDVARWRIMQAVGGHALAS